MKQSGIAGIVGIAGIAGIAPLLAAVLNLVRKPAEAANRLKPRTAVKGAADLPVVQLFLAQRRARETALSGRKSIPTTGEQSQVAARAAGAPGSLGALKNG